MEPAWGREPLGSFGLVTPHHDGSELYVDRADDSAEVRLRAPAGAAKAVLVRYLKDGEPRVVEAAVTAEKDGEAWWSAELPLRGSPTAYRWLLTGGSAGYLWVNGAGAHPREVQPADDFRLTPSRIGPDWHLTSVVYEIFLDRFAASGEPHPLPAWATRRPWDALPDAYGRNPHREIFGGDLRGVEQHLDHVASLGASVIYLTPFFPAESNHRYDPTSFERVDSLLGGDEALASLVESAHRRDLKVIGDLSLDHSGAGHEWFTRGQADASSAEHEFFLFDRSDRNGYEGWFGYKEMPRFDWRSAELRSRLGTVIERWLEAGLAGWRVGAASSIGRYGDVDLNAEVARWARSHTGDSVLLAEFWHDFETDIDGLGWHGVMNYAGFLRPLWWWLRNEASHSEVYDVFSSTPAPRYGGAEAAAVMRSARSGIPWEASLHSWLMVDSHDTPRFIEVSGTRARQLVGVGLQMTTPGVPMIYAGGEIGLRGASGYDSRRSMPWNHEEDWDKRLLAEYRRLTALRRSSDALARGGLRYAHVSDDAILFLRESRLERLLCLAARAPHEPISVPFSSLETLYGDDAHGGVLPSHGPAFHIWRIDDI
jgi:alpha-glucosidase